MLQAKAGLDALRQSKGCIVWTSSGAAAKAYKSWNAYGSSKAALNAISEHIAVEEPDITSLAISPGRVNTDMQGILRSEGEDTMDRAQWDTFNEDYKNGKLLEPEQPGHVMARFVISPQKDLSGKHVK